MWFNVVIYCESGVNFLRCKCFFRFALRKSNPRARIYELLLLWNVTRVDDVSLNLFCLLISLFHFVEEGKQLNAMGRGIEETIGCVSPSRVVLLLQ